MILYHTSDREIKSPDVFHGRPNADFGPGFYLTPDKDFTYRWARKDAVVNIYEFDETGLDIHEFSRDADWFKYIFNNRRKKDGLTVDAVVGPIANDTIFDTMGIISSGYLSPEEALALLLVGPEYTQVALKTEKAASGLTFIRSQRIERLEGVELAKEREAYGKAFEEKVKEISK